MTRAKKFVRCACGQETGLRRWINEGWLRMEVHFSDGSRKFTFTCPTCRARNVEQNTPAAVPAPTGPAVPITAPRLAAAIARAIFEDGDEGLSKCYRIQFMLGHWPNERRGGGYCESALRDRLTAKLLEWGCPPSDSKNAPRSATEGRP